MFKVFNERGRYAPMFICDHCGEQILGATNANVIYHDGKVADGDECRHSHVHKGVCDQQITAKLGGAGGNDELTTFLAFALMNSGMQLDQVDDAFETAEMLRSI